MPRISEFQRQFFANTARPSNIEAASAGADALRTVADTGAEIAFERVQQERVTQSAEEASKADKQLAKDYADIQADPEVQRNPQLSDERIKQVFEKRRGELLARDDLHPQVRESVRRRLASLESSVAFRNETFKRNQQNRNGLTALDNITDNYEELAAETSTPLDDIIDKFNRGVGAITATNRLNVNDADSVLKNGSARIVSKRVAQIFEDGDYVTAVDVVRAHDDLLDSDQQDAAVNLIAGGFAKQKPEQFLQSVKDGTFNDLLGNQETQVYVNSAKAVIAKKNEELAKAQEDVRSVAEVDAKIRTGEGFFDPKSKKDQRAVDLYFQQAGGTEGLLQLDPAAAQASVEIANGTGIMPKQTKDVVRGYMASGTQEQKLYASDLIARVQEGGGQAIDQFSKKEISEALLRVKYVRSGVDPARVEEFVATQTNVLNEGIMSLRKTQMTEAMKEIDVEEQIIDTFDEAFFSDPDLPEATKLRDQAIVDYTNIYEGVYLQTGDTDVANEMASGQLKRLYGSTTSFGSGDIVMKYPPEKYYEVSGVDNEWMREQLLRDVNKQVAENKAKSIGVDLSRPGVSTGTSQRAKVISNAYAGEAGIEPEDIALIPDSRTAREVAAGKPPTYTVVVRGKDEIFRELRDENTNVLRYAFDTSEAVKEASDKQQKRLQKSKTKRDIVEEGNPTEEEKINRILILEGLKSPVPNPGRDLFFPLLPGE